MPKSFRHGSALTLSTEQLDAVMDELAPNIRAVLSTCRFTAARITEALSLVWENITPTDVVIPRAVTKKKMKTRTIPMNPKLHEELKKWREMWPTIFKREPESKDFLFPGRDSFDVHMTSQNVDYALRAACKKLGIVGASTHSFRRSAITACSDKGISARVIMTLSGHSSMDMVQRYIDVKDDAKRAAALAFG